MKIKNTILIGIFLSIFVFFSFNIENTIQDNWVVPTKYKTMKNPTKTTKENIAIGKTLYNKHCKSCHGNKGMGNGPKTMNLDTKIRDLRSHEFKSQKQGEIYYKSFIGRNEMPNFEKKITDIEDRWFIVNYINTFKN